MKSPRIQIKLTASVQACHNELSVYCDLPVFYVSGAFGRIGKHVGAFTSNWAGLRGFASMPVHWGAIGAFGRNWSMPTHSRALADLSILCDSVQ